MPGLKRSLAMPQDEVGVYHCFNRCVQRAFLCGYDSLEQIDYSHRKVWIREKLRRLASAFGVDLLKYSLMDNHLHLLLRNRPDLVASWSDEEVARRWWEICPERREKNAEAAEPQLIELAHWLNDPEKMRKLRARLTGCEETTGGGTGSSPGDPLPSTAGSSNSSTTNACGAIEYRTSKGYLFNNPTPQTWKNVLTFQEQAVLVAAAGAGNCITFQEKTVCSPCVGPADTTSVCATVATTVDCQCTCNCGDSGGSYPASGDSGGGTSSSCSCSCICHASSSISFG